MSVFFDDWAPDELRNAAERFTYRKRTNWEGKCWIEWGPQTKPFPEFKADPDSLFPLVPHFRFEGGGYVTNEGIQIDDFSIPIYSPLESWQRETGIELEQKQFDLAVEELGDSNGRVASNKVREALFERDSLARQLERIFENLNVKSYPGLRSLLMAWLLESSLNIRNHKADSAAFKLNILDLHRQAEYIWTLFITGADVAMINDQFAYGPEQKESYAPAFMIEATAVGLARYGRLRDSILRSAANVDARRVALESIIALAQNNLTIASSAILDDLRLKSGYTSEQQKNFLLMDKLDETALEYYENLISSSGNDWVSALKKYDLLCLGVGLPTGRLTKSGLSKRVKKGRDSWAR